MRKLVLALIFVSQTLQGQTTPNQPEDHLGDLFNKIQSVKKTNPDSALLMLQKHIRIARDNEWYYDESRLRSLQVGTFIRLGDYQQCLDSIAVNLAYFQEWADRIPAIEKDYLRRNYGTMFLEKGNVYMFQGKYDSSVLLCKEAVKIIRPLDLPNRLIASRLATINITLGVNFYNQGQLDSAINYMDSSVEQFILLKDSFNIAINYLNIATISLNKQDYRGALQYYIQSLEISEANNYTLTGQLLGGINQVYFALKDYTRALEYAQRGYKLAQEKSLKNDAAFISIDIGDAFKKLGIKDSAKWYFENGLELHRALGNVDDQAYIIQRIANLLVEQGQYTEALEHIGRGQTLIDELDIPEEELRLKVIEAESYYYLGRQPEALRTVNQAMKLASNTDNLNHRRDVYGIAYQIYESNGQTSNALQALKNYTSLQDSALQEEKLIDIARVEFDYQLKNETERLELEKAQQAELYEKELEKERLVQQAAIGGGLLSLVILIILYRSYLLKKQKNKELSEKNEAISQLRDTEKKMAEETLALKERELTTITMLSHERNSLLQQLGTQIGGLTEKVDDEVIPDLKEIKRTINSNLSEESWSAFMYQFEKVHPQFFNALKARFSNLTQHDLRICAYLRVGMERKEIASITNTTPEAAKKSLYRLKKKMQLDGDTDLRAFLMQV